MSVLKMKTENGYAPIGFESRPGGWELISQTITTEDLSVISYEIDMNKYSHYYFSINLFGSDTFSSVYIVKDGYGNNLFSSYTTPEASSYHTLSGDIMTAPYGVSDKTDFPMPIVFGRMSKSSNTTVVNASAFLRYSSSGAFSKDGLHFKGTFSSGTKIWLYGA